MMFKKILSLVLCLAVVTAFLPCATIVNATTEVVFTDCLTVNFDLSSIDETASMDSLFAIPGDSVTLPDCTIENIGFAFAGWSTSPDSDTADYLANDILTVTENITLYPVWVRVLRKYQVRHYYELHTKPEKQLFLTEEFEAYSGDTTNAAALNLLGYTASSFRQQIVSATKSTQVTIVYNIKKYRANDVNYDGKVDMVDLAVLQRYLAHWDGYDVSKVCIYGADTDVNGGINANDVLTLLHILAGNSPTVGTPDIEDDWGDWI